MRQLGQFTEDVILPGVERIVKDAKDEICREMTTKEDLKDFATKEDVNSSEVRILQAVDKIAIGFDTAEKNHAADKLLHDRHEKRLERVEAKLGVK